MNEQNPFEMNMNKPSSMLNVITILSIIGSVFALISAGVNFFLADQNLENMQKAMQAGTLEDAPGFVKAFVNKASLEMAQNMADNKLPIMILSLVGGVLCLYGAIEMRKLKAQGFWLWLVGELLPIITLLIFAGTNIFSGFSFIGYLFPLAFIIMYSVCRKELIN